MNKIKLPSMVEYVKKQNPNLPFVTRFVNCENYADFLSQQPNIGMFVTAVFEDGEWRILTEPKEYFEWCKWGDFTKYGKSITPKCKEYHEALNNVIFDGWYLRCPNAVTNDVLSITFTKSGGILLDRVCRDHHENIGTINSLENLSHYNLTLTPKFAKELGLI